MTPRARGKVARKTSRSRTALTPPAPGPLSELLQEGRSRAAEFDFLQALRLLEHAFTDGLRLREADAHADRIQHPRIAIRPYEGLGFPAADVHGLEPAASETDGPTLVVRFLGLYGVDSPLPSHFSAAALYNEDGEAPALRAFLDIFNTRIYTLLYHAIKKYRPSLQSETAHPTERNDVFACIAGLGAPARDDVVPVQTLIPFAGVLRSPVRNREGLERLIADQLPGISVVIDENVPRWITLDSRPHLGNGAEPMTLGATALLGASLCDASGRFRVVLGPLTWSQFEQLRPGGQDARRLDALVRLYTPDFLDYEVELRIRSSDLPTTRLGSSSNRVGRTTWVGTPRQQVVSEVVTYA